MSVATVKCEQCGSTIPVTARFCPLCGHINPAYQGDVAATGSNGPVDAGSMVRVDANGASSDATPPYGNPTVNISETGAPPAYTPPMSQQTADQSATLNLNTTASASTAAAYTSQNPPPQGQYGYTPPTQPISTPAPPPNYPAYSQSPLGYAQQPQPGVAGIPMRDPTIALLLELIGYVWVLGIGHIYAGRITRGVTLMLGYWAYWIVVGVLFVTVILSPVACVMALIHPVVPILSGLWIRSDLEREQMSRRTY